jgi:hypothetical protein
MKQAETWAGKPCETRRLFPFQGLGQRQGRDVGAGMDSASSRTHARVESGATCEQCDAALVLREQLGCNISGLARPHGYTPTPAMG